MPRPTEVFSHVIAGDASPLAKELLLCRAKGEGGSKSVRPSWCSDVMVGTWNDMSEQFVAISFLATFTASLSPDGIKLAAQLLASLLPLLDELPVLLRTANGRTGGRRGDVGIVSTTATEACHHKSDDNNKKSHIKLYLRPYLRRECFPLSI